MVAMPCALQDNTSLTELRLSCQLEAAGSLAIANCMRRNANIDVLIIHNTGTTQDSDSAGSSLDISSSSLDTRAISGSRFAEIAHALRSNQSLKTFPLQGTRLTIPVQNTFLDMLRQNYTLNIISLLDLTSELENEMDMYTLLNRSGRGRLFIEGSSRREWIDTMAIVSEDLDCLFYLLSTRSSLCDIESGSRKRSMVGKPDLDQRAKRSKPSQKLYVFIDSFHALFTAAKVADSSRQAFTRSSNFAFFSCTK